MSNSGHNRKSHYNQTISSKLITYFFAGSMVFIGLEIIDREHGGIGNLIKHWTGSAIYEFSGWTTDLQNERASSFDYSPYSRKRISFFNSDRRDPSSRASFSSNIPVRKVLQAEPVKVPSPKSHLENKDREEHNSLINNL